MKFFGLYIYMIPHNFGVHVLAHNLMEKHSRWLQKVESTGRCLDFSFLLGRPMQTTNCQDVLVFLVLDSFFTLTI